MSKIEKKYNKRQALNIFIDEFIDLLHHCIHDLGSLLTLHSSPFYELGSLLTLHSSPFYELGSLLTLQEERLFLRATLMLQKPIMLV